MNYDEIAEKALNGLPLTDEECQAVLNCSGEDILALLHAAFQVRKTFFGRTVFLHMLFNAKSGLCSEDCSYCSQSKISNARIMKYPLVDGSAILSGARTAENVGAKRYCIVTSGRSLERAELNKICDSIKRIKQEMKIEICTSLGLLTKSDAAELKKAGVDRYNHNFNTSEQNYSNICSTHSFNERIETLQNARAAGMELCCGAIFGMGENQKNIIDIALALKNLSPDSIPVNFLNPVPGTPLEGADNLTPLKCLSILCLMRFLNPSTEIRIAGGREHNLGSLQALSLYPANSIFVSNYLTTPGQTPEEVVEMIKDVGFEIEEERSHEINASMKQEKSQAAARYLS